MSDVLLKYRIDYLEKKNANLLAEFEKQTRPKNDTVSKTFPNN